MPRRRWWIGGGVIAAALIVIAVLTVVFLANNRTPDCTTVRSMITYNDQFNQGIESATAANTQPSVEDYQNWASQLEKYAGEIHDQSLAQHANAMADLATRTVSVVKQFRSDPQTDEAPPSAPPQYAKDYAQLGQEFNTNLVALEDACRT
ncbi:hypothetical protein [Mycobacterium sp. MMS18-G62]